MWLRADGALPDDPVLHACVLTYASDMTLLDTAVRPHGGCWGDEGLMMASLDHAMWFHRPFRADDWLLYDQDTPVGVGQPRPRARQHLHAGRAPRGHRRAGGPDPGAARVRRLAGRRWRSSRLLGACTDDEPAADPADLVDHDHDRAWRHHHLHRSAAGDPRSTRSSSGSRRSPSSTSPSRWRPGPGSPDLYIAEKGGRVRLIEVEEDEFGDDEGELTYELQTTPLLDISDEVINEGERGLLGMAFSSDGRKLYLDYTRQPDGHTVVVEYTLGDGTRIDEDSRRELLFVEQPFANHNGGQLAVGPDGYLYVGLGDGGGGGDPLGHGQDTATLLGSILRIDPEGGDRGRPRLRHPAGQPLRRRRAAGRRRSGSTACATRGASASTPRPATSGSADVGQDDVEEIDRLPADGGLRRRARAPTSAGTRWRAPTPSTAARTPTGAVLPIFEYGRDQGCSVIGGYVYRGEDIPGLQGTYLYADYCGTGVRGLQVDGGTVIDTRTWDLPIDRTVLVRPGRRRRAVRAPRRRPRREARRRPRQPRDEPRTRPT